MNLSDIHRLVVRPTLLHLADADPGLHSIAAEQLMLGTGMAESRFIEICQQPTGPAISPWQIEAPTTTRDIERYLKRPDKTLLNSVVSEMIADWPRDIDRQITTNLCLSCAYARIRYWYVPESLPNEGDVEGMASYWLTHYNAGGKGTMTKFAQPFREFVLPLF